MTAPTPQFTPVLDRLAREHPEFAVRAFYRDLSDRGRGWGKLRLHHPHTSVPRTPLRQFRIGWRTASSRDVKCVVVFGYSNWLALGALARARLRGTPVFTQSDSSAALDTQPVRRIIKQLALRALYPRSTTAWVISDDNRRYWQRYGVRRTVPVPFESPVTVNDAAREGALRLKSLVAPGNKVILTVARVVPEKGIYDLIDAVSDLRSTGVGVELFVVGRTGAAPTLPQQSGIHFLGALPRDELGAAYLAADIFALASHREPYGLVVREALQFGLPVVATRGVPAAVSLCDRGWNIVEPRDVARLAPALARALTEPRWARRPPIDTTDFYAEQLGSITGRSIDSYNAG